MSASAAQPRDVIFLGPPGAGKGTQAQILQKTHGLTQVSTGDLLRRHRAEGTALGKAAQVYMDRGDLVPDALIVDMMEGELDAHAGGVLLDGFPRTVAQAEALDALLARKGRPQAIVVLFDISPRRRRRPLVRPLDEPADRPRVQRGNPPARVPGIDDDDGGPLVQRDDDKPETVRKRLSVYREQTAPLIGYYEPAGGCTSSTPRSGWPRWPRPSTHRSLRPADPRVITIKSAREIEIMRVGGKITARTLAMLARTARAGMTTRELDRLAEKSIREQGGVPTFKGYNGFPASICASVNDVVVHGIPGDYVLKDGDLLSIDIGTTFQGYVSDTAVTVPIGNVSEAAAFTTGDPGVPHAGDRPDAAWQAALRHRPRRSRACREPRLRGSPRPGRARDRQADARGARRCPTTARPARASRSKRASAWPSSP